MFEFGREIKRLFAADAPPRDGLTGGDPSFLELLDMDLLRSEARAADIAAGRISVKDPAQRRLEAARVWRELARRTGDPIALRNAALAAERAVQAFKAGSRMKGWAGSLTLMRPAAMSAARASLRSRSMSSSSRKEGSPPVSPSRGGASAANRRLISRPNSNMRTCSAVRLVPRRDAITTLTLQEQRRSRTRVKNLRFVNFLAVSPGKRVEALEPFRSDGNI